MYNIRYHIASLVAVFLALAIGLLLGTVVVERGTLDRQRDSIVKSLQDEFRTLTDENDTLRTDNEQLDALVEDLVPAVSGDSLVGKHFLVITSAGRADGLNAVTQAIEQAGGAATVLTESDVAMALADPLVSQVATPVVGDVSGEELILQSAKALAGEWMDAGSDRTLTTALSEAGAISFDESPPADVAFDGVVVMAAWQGVPDDMVLEIAKEFVRADRVGVGIETGSNTTGVASASIAKGLSAIDNANSPAGELSVVWVLSRRASGYFGTSDAADAPWPVLEVNGKSPKD